MPARAGPAAPLARGGGERRPRRAAGLGCQLARCPRGEGWPCACREPADPKTAAKRAEYREARVAIGLAELDRWLCDQVRQGLAASQRAGYSHWDDIGARMVDAQAPGPAERLRDLGITGAVVQDPVSDRVVWQEYLETVVRERDDWSDFYRACRDAAG